MRWIIIAVLLSISTLASATHYYVKNAGSDGNTGLSDAQAWATISKVNSKTFAAGDTVTFKCGDTWRESLLIPSGGNSNINIFFGNYGTGEKPKILGSDAVSGWTNQGNNIWRSTNTFPNNPQDYDADIHFIEASGNVDWGYFRSGTSTLAHEFDWTYSSKYVYIYSTSDPSAKYSGVEVPQRFLCIDTDYKEYLHIKGIDCLYAEYIGIDSYSQHSNHMNKTGLIIENCEVGFIGGITTDQSGFGIAVVYSDLVIRGCKIHNCGRRGISLDNYGYGFTATNALIEMNEIYGGYHTTALDCNTGASGYTANWDGIVFRRNLVYEEINKPMLYPSNQIFLQRYNSTTLKNVYIYSNIFKYAGGNSISIERADYVYIYNNTFYGHHPDQDPTNHIYLDVSPTNITIKNNIFYTLLSSTTGKGISSNLTDAQNRTMDVDYNLYYRINNNLPIIGLTTQYYMNSAFPIAVGWEAHGVKADPLFVSDSDYHILSGSPAAGKGVPVSVVESDFNGDGFSSPPNIGCYNGTVKSGNPIYVSSQVTNATPSTLEITYSLNLAGNIVPDKSAFTVLVNSIARSVTNVSVIGSKVYLTLSSPIVKGDVIFLSYAVPVTNPLQTPTGDLASALDSQPVTNNVLPVSPVYASSSVENTTPSLLTMVYSLSLANIVPDKSAFIVKVNSVVRTITLVSISGTKVLLTLNSPIIYSDVITVSYTKPSVNPLQTSEGGLAANISNKSVTNNVLPPSPVYVSSVIENATPSILRMTYSLSLKNVVPATTAFTVMVNSVKRNVNPVAISGTNVLLTLASPVSAGDVVTVAYTKPSSNPLQTAAGGLAVSISAQPVTNNVGVSNNLPVIVIDYEPNAYSGIVDKIDASGSYDIDKDNLTYSWTVPDNIPVSSTSASVIQFLPPVVSSARTVDFILNLSDGKGVQSLTIPVQILPFMSGVTEATFSDAAALSYLAPDKPANIIDNNLTTKWSGSGDGNWVVLKLKKPFKIEYLQIAFPDSQQGSSIFDVSASVDSLSWDNNILSTVTSCSFSGNYQIFEFPDIYKSTDYSYLKITGHGNTVDKWNYISELKAFGYPYGGSQDQGMFSFSIYPNPASDHLVISFEDQTPSDLALVIISQTGEVVRKILIPQGTYINPPINPLNLQPGFYLLQLQSGNTIVGAKKLVVTR